MYINRDEGSIDLIAVESFFFFYEENELQVGKGFYMEPKLSKAIVRGLMRF